MRGGLVFVDRLLREAPATRGIVSATRGNHGQSIALGAARAGMVNLSMTLAHEWAWAGVRVNAVSPGWIASSGMDTYTGEFKELIPTLPGFCPLGRLATESEVSAAVCFLLSEAAGYVTGTELRIDGGTPLEDRERAITAFNAPDSDVPLTYGDVFLQNEQEQSAYNFEHADTDMLFRHFADAEKECGRMISARLPLPAYEQCIKASHAFNLLDARGVISVTERQSYILRVRELAKACGEAWLRTEAGGA